MAVSARASAQQPPLNISRPVSLVHRAAELLPSNSFTSLAKRTMSEMPTLIWTSLAHTARLGWGPESSVGLELHLRALPKGVCLRALGLGVATDPPPFKKFSDWIILTDLLSLQSYLGWSFKLDCSRCSLHS